MTAEGGVGRAGRGRVGSCRAATEMSQERKREPRPRCQHADFTRASRAPLQNVSPAKGRDTNTAGPKPGCPVYSRGKAPLPVPDGMMEAHGQVRH